jgi:hypothetical protein
VHVSGPCWCRSVGTGEHPMLVQVNGADVKPDLLCYMLVERKLMSHHVFLSILLPRTCISL